MNSDEVVASLQPYGIVRACQSDDKTFYARAILFMHGMKAEVSSDWNHPSMLSALLDLQVKVFAVVNKPLTTALEAKP